MGEGMLAVLFFMLAVLSPGGLEYDVPLASLAQDRADELAEAGEMRHDLVPYMQARRCSAFGEILMRYASEPGEALLTWWASPQHRRVMVDHRFDRAGIAASGDVIVVAYEGGCIEG